MKTGNLSRVIRPIDLKLNPAIELSTNTLYNYDDHFGLIKTEPEPKTFFNIEKNIDGGSRLLETLNLKRELFNWAIFSLSDVEKTYEREVYSFMQALGDFGGFNDGIVIIPAILMSIYSQKMYLRELFSFLPVKR